MKILHLVQHFYPCTGGIETYVLGFCEQLIKAGHTSDVACLNTCSSSHAKLPRRENLGSIHHFLLVFMNPKTSRSSPSLFSFLGLSMKKMNFIL